MFSVVLNEFRGFYRQGSNFFFCIMFPSLLVFLLGTLLAQFDISDYSVGEINIQYYYSAENAAAEQFLAGLEEEEAVSGSETYDLQASIRALEAGGADCVADIGNNQIKLYMGTDAVKNQTVKALFDSFSQVQKTYAAAARVNPQAIAQAEDKSFVSAKNLGVNRTMIDYYAVTMLVMILFMGCTIGGADVFHSEVKMHTDMHLRSSPVGRMTVFFGKVIGAILMPVTQICAVMVTSTMFFGAHYCAAAADNILLIGMFLAVSLAVLAVGIFVSLFIRFSPVILFLPLMWVMMFVSGTFAKEIYVEGLTELMPMYIVQEAAFDLTIFGDSGKAWLVIFSSIIIFFVFLLAGAYKFGRKGMAK